jgi:L-alanine-DL-glutamate epimerase-like enolase superfamily enzyme
MSKPTDIVIKQTSCDTQRIVYRAPMKFGGRVVRDVVLFNAVVDVETRDGRRGRGHGSMTMGNVWAWPSQSVSSEQTLEAMIHTGQRLVEQAADYPNAGHVLDITADWATSYGDVARQVTDQMQLAEPMPRLAQLVAASPLEAALHDAYGNELSASAYNLLGPEYANPDLSFFLNDRFRGEYLDAYTLRQPKPSMPLYHLVGALDPLSDSDIEQRIGDGLPETLAQWVAADGLTHLKIKLAGDDLAWDVARVVDVDRVTAEVQSDRGCRQWYYSLDFNEKCANVQYVLEFLARVEQLAPHAYARVQYIEQPTHRDLRAHRDNRMHEAARIKPVVIDESLVDLESLLLARQQGYSGVALKACKGHSEALLMGAAAQKYGLFLCVQDLTCVGASFLHSASLAARIPTVAAIEGNGRQYCPQGNAGWRDRYPGMFNVHQGSVRTEELAGTGLGFSCD